MALTASKEGVKIFTDIGGERNKHMPRAFFDLKIWQKAEKLTLDIYRITKDFPRQENYGLTSQIQRAAVSVAANIAEGYGHFHLKNKFRSFYISRAEISEIRSHLRIAWKLKYINESNYREIDDNYEGLTLGINCLIKSLAQKLDNSTTG